MSFPWAAPEVCVGATMRYPINSCLVRDDMTLDYEEWFVGK